MQTSNYFRVKSALHFHRGFTLLEMLIVLTITAILMALGSPSFYALSAQSKSKSTIQKLSGLVRLARNSAVNHQTPIVLCPSKNGLACGKSWQEGVLIFEDQNNDKQLSKTETLVHFQSPLIESGSIQWSALHNYLSFSGEGLSGNSAGSFVYCPEDNNPKYANSLIISFSGKIRRAGDDNHDGIRESGNSKNIVCL
tara:strand:+ start:358 stop:948 length:591 start_codon:yes stop_codon:yes gene_type:complete